MESSQTIEKTMLLLETLASQGPCRASVITKALDIHRSSSYRMLGSLVKLGYVLHHEESGQYSLSRKMESFTDSGTAWGWLKNLADPLLAELYDDLNETMHLAVLHNNEISYLSKWESSRSLRVVVQSQAGGHAPLYCTGLGKMLLAGQEKDERERIVKDIELKPFTPATIRTSDALNRELDTIATDLVSFDNEEHEEGVNCIAVPLLNREGEIIAAISITVPSLRFTDHRKKELLALMQNTGRRISALIDEYHL
ncbi:MAG: IclR family transcriptional regulator [Spirochaetales bacterium]|nr:IclR family transcriptional regulator [Spirochaetales bacterium]